MTIARRTSLQTTDLARKVADLEARLALLEKALIITTGCYTVLIGG